MKKKALNKPIFIIISVLFGILILLGIYIFITNETGYYEMEKYENIKIITTDTEGRVDDIEGRSLVRNVMYWRKFENKIYIIDSNMNKITVDIYSKEITKYENSKEILTDSEKRIFNSLELYHDYKYLYD